MESVIALAFGDTGQVRNAVRGRQNLHRSRDIGLDAVAIVARIQDGRSIVLGHVEGSQLRWTTGGLRLAR